jgi:phosphoglycerol transferase
VQTIKKFKILPTKLKLRSDLLAGISGMLLCTFLALYLINGEMFTLNLDTPFIFHGDGLSHQILVTRLNEGWWINNIRQGFPFGSNHLGYPISENAILLFLKVLLTLGISATTSINLLLLIGFPLAFLVTFFVLQSFKINRALSFVGGMLYSFTTYHVYHFEHFMYASYFIVPIYFWVSFQLIVSEKRSKCLNNRFFVFCLLVALSGFATYYVIFGGILMSFSMFFFVKRERVVIQIKRQSFYAFFNVHGFGRQLQPKYLVLCFSPKR